MSYLIGYRLLFELQSDSSRASLSGSYGICNTSRVFTADATATRMDQFRLRTLCGSSPKSYGFLSRTTHDPLLTMSASRVRSLAIMTKKYHLGYNNLYGSMRRSFGHSCA